MNELLSRKCTRVGVRHSGIVLLVLFAVCFRPAFGQDASTDFEPPDVENESTNFTIGMEPKTATFTGGISQTTGIVALYSSGFHAWMVGAGETGTITFETPAQEVTLFFKDQTDAVMSLLTFRDAAGQPIQQFDGTPSGSDINRFTKVNLTNVAVKTITLENRDSGSGGSPWAVIDDFSFTAQVEQPAPTLLFPDFVDGLFMEQPNATRVVLRNNDSLEVSGRIRFRKPMGVLTQVSVGGQLSDTIDFNIAGFGVLDVETDGTGNFQMGSAEVLVDSGDGSDLEGTLIFSVLGNFVSVDAAPPRTAQQAFVSFNSSENTGTAILNPDAATASMLELTLVRDGEEQATAQLEVKPLHQIVGFVDEAGFFEAFFKANPGDFTGTLNIRVLTGPQVTIIGLVQKRDTGALIAVSTSEKAFESSAP